MLNQTLQEVENSPNSVLSLSSSASEPTHSITSQHTPQGWAYSPIPLFILVGVLLFIVTEARREIKKRLSLGRERHFSDAERIPCRGCRFFSSNFYLKCAVRPSDVLTKRAANCSDYCFDDLKSTEDTGKNSKPQ